MNTTSTLCTAIEKALHRKLKSPKDFDLLSQSIWDRLHEQVSSTTLKRIWGLIVEGELLYIDDLQQEGHPPVVYVCGKKSGVRFDYPLK